MSWKPATQSTVTNNYTIQPDIQYVIRPNGASDIKNAVVIGIQFIANF